MNSFWQHYLIKNIGPAQAKGILKTQIETLLSLAIIALAVSAMLWGQVPSWQVTAYAGVNIIAIIARISDYFYMKKTNNEVRRAILSSMFFSFAFAAPTSIIVAANLDALPIINQLSLAVLITGIAAAGVFHLISVFPSAIVYLVTLLLPVSIKYFTINNYTYQTIGALTFLYGFFLIRAAMHGASLSIRHSQSVETLRKQVVALDNAKEDMRKFAMEDSLTKLPNRREFHLQLDAAFATAHEEGSSIALLIGDLDHFKAINDISGHAAGDKLLQAISDRLKQEVGDDDFVARIGGDEFAIVGKNHASPKGTSDFAKRLLEVINKPVFIDGTSIIPGMSIGISMFPYDARDVESLLSHADHALQRSKNSGRGQIHFFDQEMKSQLSADQVIEDDLRIALTEQEFELVYQPKVSIKTGRLQGFEALVRWRRNDGKLLAPGEFFGVAEDRGLMPYICDFVLQQVLHDLQVWRSRGLNPGKIAVNIHPVQIKDQHRMKRFVRDIERSGLNPGDIYLEITEGCVVGRGTEDVPELLEYLRRRGLHISLDDFGTGFASLSHLKELPVDELKIDRSFVSDLMTNSTDRAIVHAMVKLASSLGISTVAEGIETQDQHNVLLAIGCTTGQGYLYNRPLSFGQASDLVENAQKAHFRKEPNIKKLTNPRVVPQELENDRLRVVQSTP